MKTPVTNILIVGRGQTAPHPVTRGVTIYGPCMLVWEDGSRQYRRYQVPPKAEPGDTDGLQAYDRLCYLEQEARRTEAPVRGLVGPVVWEAHPGGRLYALYLTDGPCGPDTPIS